MEELIRLLSQSGPYGVATAAILFMGWLYHRNILASERTRLEESRGRYTEAKGDKDQAFAIITANTEAMTKLCSAVDNCTETNRQVQSLVQRLLEK